LSLSSDSKVLDIGSDWGNVAIALSRVAGEVVALDAVYENLQFMDIRCQQESVTNVIPINADVVHYAHLPLPDNYFDLAVMIGVLPKMSDARSAASTTETQKLVLRKVRRALKPEGKLYLATENRFGFTYFLNKPDEHTNLRFVTLMPRSVADVYSRVIRNKPYRTYTYSMNSLRRLLRDCGFPKIEFFLPIPFYVKPRYYVSIESPEAFNHLLSHTLRSHPRMNSVTYAIGRLIIRLGLQRSFSPAFAVIAGS
jgi:ubiquinone/menaquinone biosynthesis C-methylase UbiE